MKMPGFTAVFSLNESRGYNVMMQKDTITRGGAVIVPQNGRFSQEIGRFLPHDELSIECPDCVHEGQSQTCAVVRWHCDWLLVFPCKRELLGHIRLPSRYCSTIPDCGR